MKLLLASAATAAATALLTTTSATVSALVPNDPCTVGWTGVQSEFKCTGDQWNTWIQEDNNLAQLVPSALVFIVGFFTFFAIILTIIFRYCCQCCGGSKLRPGHGCCGGSSLDELSEESKLSMYTPSEVWWTKTLTIFVLIVSICACALAVQGSVQSADIADIVTEGGPNFVNWVNGKVNDVKAELNTSNPDFNDAVSQINKIQNDMNKFLNDTKDFTDHADTVKKAFLGLAGPSALVVIAGLGAVICAFCSIRTCLPLLFLIVTMFAALITGSLGIGAGALDFADKVWCEEVDAFHRNESGVFKWYIVPSLCEERINFPELKNKIESDIDTIVGDACDQLANGCDASPAYSGGSKFYYCATPPSNCKTTADLSAAMKELKVKTGIPDETTCGGTCDVEQCAENCTNTDLKSESAKAYSEFSQADKAYKALQNILYPIMSCTVVTKQLLENFDICGNVKTGVTNVFAGCCLAVAASVFLTILLFMGQKRFISSSIVNRSEETRENQQFEVKYGAVMDGIKV